uniref:Uncharacterized protein n=1 Tax=Arion vulgaris TaxID=1028688 RepID=A0A0B7A731_9EUPU
MQLNREYLFENTNRGYNPDHHNINTDKLRLRTSNGGIGIHIHRMSHKDSDVCASGAPKQILQDCSCKTVPV